MNYSDRATPVRDDFETSRHESLVLCLILARQLQGFDLLASHMQDPMLPRASQGVDLEIGVAVVQSVDQQQYLI